VLRIVGRLQSTISSLYRTNITLRVMASVVLQELKDLGESIGLSRESLQTFIKDQQTELRTARIQEREDREKERKEREKVST